MSGGYVGKCSKVLESWHATRIVPGSDLANASEANTVLGRRRLFLDRFRRHQTDEQVLRASLTRTNSWRFDEKSIIVPCKTYVWTCLFLSAIIVAGGLAISFSSRVRLHGVDLFNIASFTWIAVIFMLSLAQSRYIPAWAWHDFLHSRIVCRNVTELAHVSKLNPQLVLHKLLITEKSANLHTRGPYNSIFSINVPCTTSTLWTSDFVLFLGVGKTDRHIQVSDARPTSEFLAATHHSWSKCLGVPLLSETGVQTSQVKHQNVLMLREDEFEGERILGLYMGSRQFG
ncbi:hypothetical protein TI39_contig5830g00012 [Zymoseptoria brevis]|uniref:Uncharacterized protein n=1 Tax=Zymoseptoria brevis TaxID=1047168 RepID=A0A0F4G5U9_9PEZI|nr:hypothetical protein TI39_contig5830g00012 [Zymoseptoria brevis]